MKDTRLQFIITREAHFYLSEFSVRIGRKTEDGKWAIMRPTEFRVVTPDEEGFVKDPAMLMSRDDVQRLMDELWNVGIRPSEGSGSAGQLAAVQAHLKDMQRLVFEPPVRS